MLRELTGTHDFLGAVTIFAVSTAMKPSSELTVAFDVVRLWFTA